MEVRYAPRNYDVLISWKRPRWTSLAALACFIFLLCSTARSQNAESTDSPSPSTQNKSETKTEQGEPGSTIRLEFPNGQFLEFAVIRDFPKEPGEKLSFWRPSGVPTEKRFRGARARPPLKVKDGEIKRQFFVRGVLPTGTQLNLTVPNQRYGGGSETGITEAATHEFGQDRVATFPEVQKTTDARLQIALPVWRPIAMFDAYGGFQNGVTMDRERKADGNADVIATGDFGGEYLPDQIRIVGVSRNHELMHPQQRGASGSPAVSRLSAKFENAVNKLRKLIVQVRAPGVTLVIRDISLHPQQKSRPRVFIEKDDGTQVPIELTQEMHSLELFLDESPPGFAADLTPEIHARLVSLTSSSTPGIWWAADGSLTFPPDLPEDFPAMPASDDDRHHVSAQFALEFTNIEDRRAFYDRLSMFIDDEWGRSTYTRMNDTNESTTTVPYIIVRNLHVLSDRVSTDLKLNVACDPWRDVDELKITDPPDDFDPQKWFGYEPQADGNSFVFPANDAARQAMSGEKSANDESEASDNKDRPLQTFIAAIPSPADGTERRLVAVTESGERLERRSAFRVRDGRLLGHFRPKPGDRIAKIILQERPLYSCDFRNVALYPNASTPAFVELPPDAGAVQATQFASAKPARIFKTQDGRLISEGNTAAVALHAIEQIQQAGGFLRFDAQADAPTGQSLPVLTEIRWKNMSDAQLNWLRPIGGLRRLDLNSGRFTNTGLESLEPLTTLEELEVSNNDNITTACLRSIGRLTQLRELELSASLAPDRPGFNGKDFSALSNLTELREFEPYDWRLNDEAMKCLWGMTKLELVYFSGGPLTDEGFIHLTRKPNLGVIFMPGTEVTDASFQLLENHPRLYWLECSGPNVTDASISSLLTIKNLRTVSLRNSQVTDAGLERLIAGLDQLPRLEDVSLTGSRVTAAGVRRLKSAREGLRVFFRAEHKTSKIAPAPENVPLPVTQHNRLADAAFLEPELILRLPRGE